MSESEVLAMPRPGDLIRVDADGYVWSGIVLTEVRPDVLGPGVDAEPIGGSGGLNWTRLEHITAVNDEPFQYPAEQTNP